jgi:hypothetical protein
LWSWTLGVALERRSSKVCEATKFSALCQHWYERSASCTELTCHCVCTYPSISGPPRQWAMRPLHVHTRPVVFESYQCDVEAILFGWMEHTRALHHQRNALKLMGQVPTALATAHSVAKCPPPWPLHTLWPSAHAPARCCLPFHFYCAAAVVRASGNLATSRYLPHLAATTSVSAFSGGLSSGHIDLGGSLGFLPVSLCVIPREASRHNCPTRPDVIAKLLRGPLGGIKHTPDADADADAPSDGGTDADSSSTARKRARVTPTATLVVLLPSVEEHDPESQCMSVAAAIARAAPPLFSRKTGSTHDDAVVEVQFFVGGDPCVLIPLAVLICKQRRGCDGVHQHVPTTITHTRTCGRLHTGDASIPTQLTLAPRLSHAPPTRV